jgi:hypothetical protein
VPVQVDVVHAHMPLVVVLLAYKDGVRQPLRMGNLLDEAYCE